MIDDGGELDDLARDLTKAGVTAGLKAVVALEVTGPKMRDEIRRLAPRTGLPHYAAKITHEVTIGKGSVDLEVGPERGGQGSLGAILENGTSRTPPHAHVGPGFDRELPDAMKRLGDIAGDVL